MKKTLTLLALCLLSNIAFAQATQPTTGNNQGSHESHMQKRHEHQEQRMQKHHEHHEHQEQRQQKHHDRQEQRAERRHNRK